jgi:hypothetical protein
MLTTGQVVVTAIIDSLMNANLSFYAFVFLALQRHQNLDFGDLCDHDREANLEALKSSSRVLSMYFLPDCLGSDYKKIYIITEADRSCTTVLFPHEY